MRRRDLDAELDVRRLPEIRRRERPFEYALRDELGRRGVKFVKTKPTVRGFPDRLAIGHGRTQLVECKREDGGLSKVQEVVRRDLARAGVDVLVVAGPDVKAAADLVEARLRDNR